MPGSGAPSRAGIRSGGATRRLESQSTRTASFRPISAVRPELSAQSSTTPGETPSDVSSGELARKSGGSTRVAWVPSGLSSPYTASVSPSTANLAAVQTPKPMLDRMLRSDAMSIAWPLRRAGDEPDTLAASG